MGRFIELVSGVIPPQGMVEAVHRQTEGNPLFVTEARPRNSTPRRCCPSGTPPS